jgi:hypothetical protein
MTAIRRRIRTYHTAFFEAGVPNVGALAGDAQLVGDLGLGAALGEQLGGLQPAGLKGGTLLGRVGAAGSRHRRTLTQHQPSVNLTHETQIPGVGCRVDGS